MDTGSHEAVPARHARTGVKASLACDEYVGLLPRSEDSLSAVRAPIPVRPER
jgi:hypothetical protein